MSLFERYLTLWVFLCIIAGIALGHFLPGLFGAISAMEDARVNLPVPVMLSVVWIVNNSKGWYERGLKAGS